MRYLSTAMLNNIVLLTVALFFIGIQIREASTVDVETPFPEISAVIKSKCLKNADIKAYDEILQTAGETDTIFPVRNSTQESKTKDGDMQVCQDNANSILEYLTKIIEKLEPCLEPKEMYLKKFVVDSFHSSRGELCEYLINLNDTTTEHLKNCREMFAEDPEKDPQEVCLRKSSVFGSKPTVDVVTKLDLCQDIFNVDDCYGTLLHKYCPNVETFHRILLMGYMRNCMDVMVHGTTETSEEATEPNQ